MEMNQYCISISHRSAMELICKKYAIKNRWLKALKKGLKNTIASGSLDHDAVEKNEPVT
jgi:hypothetical protein